MAAPQSIRILQKDLRHLWPETLFVLLLFAAFAFAAPSGWNGSEYAAYASILAVLLKVLMPISWLVMISRLIQDESLVGDRQFWTSRPYHWGKLLAAKVIFLIVCIYMPFFLMQVYLLKHAGLHPMTSLPALLHNLLLLTVVFIIPIAALAAVTSNFPRLLLSFLGTVLYLLVLVVILGYVTFLQMQPPHLDWILNGLFIVLPAVALLFQYRTRKTFISRTMLIATPILATIILLLVPTNSLIASAYPVLDKDAPKLTGLSDTFHPPAAQGKLQVFRNNVSVSLPVGVGGIDKDMNFLVVGTRTTVTGSGVTYKSGFQSSGSDGALSAGRPMTLLSFLVPSDVFNKIRTAPVDVHLQLAVEQLKAEKPSVWHATLLPFTVPGNGLCSFPADGSAAPPTCRYPLVQPEISFVTAQLAAGACGQPMAQPVTGQGSLGGRGTMLDFDPVITVPLQFRTGDPNPKHNYVLCPGTALNFVEASKVGKASVVFDQKQVVLDAFAARIAERQSPLQQAPAGESPDQ